MNKTNKKIVLDLLLIESDLNDCYKYRNIINKKISELEGEKKCLT
jgi:hypothetical protein